MSIGKGTRLRGIIACQHHDAVDQRDEGECYTNRINYRSILEKLRYSSYHEDPYLLPCLQSDTRDGYILSLVEPIRSGSFHALSSGIAPL